LQRRPIAPSRPFYHLVSITFARREVIQAPAAKRISFFDSSFVPYEFFALLALIEATEHISAEHQSILKMNIHAGPLPA
jgi:hypothetical protein